MILDSYEEKLFWFDQKLYYIKENEKPVEGNKSGDIINPYEVYKNMKIKKNTTTLVEGVKYNTELYFSEETHATLRVLLNNDNSIYGFEDGKKYFVIEKYDNAFDPDEVFGPYITSISSESEIKD